MADQTDKDGSSNTGGPSSAPETGRPWTIAEMAEEFGVSYRTLRFYEQKGLLAPRRRGNARLYFRRDFIHMKIITSARRMGMPLLEVGEILDAYHQARGQEIQDEMVFQRLTRHLQNLEEQQTMLTGQIKIARDVLNQRNGRSN